MPEAAARNKSACPVCGGQNDQATPSLTCAYCGSKLPETTALARPSGFTLPRPGGLLGKLLSDPKSESFRRGLGEIAADAQKSGVFSTIGVIIKILLWIGILFFAALAVSVTVAAFKGRETAILFFAAAFFALLSFILFWFSQGTKGVRTSKPPY